MSWVSFWSPLLQQAGAMAVKPTRDSCRLHHTPAEIFSQVSLDHEAQDLRMSSLPSLLTTEHSGEISCPPVTNAARGRGRGVHQGSLLKEQVTELQAPSEAALGTLPACKYSFAACRQMGHNKCSRHRSHAQAHRTLFSRHVTAGLCPAAHLRTRCPASLCLC